MKTKQSKTLLAAMVCLLFASPVRSENLNDILNQISTDLEKKSSGGNKTSSDEPEKKAVQTTPVKQAETAKKTSKPKPSAASKRPEPTLVPEAPKLVVHRAGDKLPKDFRGHGLAGRFLITATNLSGNPLIVSADDTINPFARQFWVVNWNAGLGPNRTFSRDDHVVFDVPPERPLIFVGIFLPGCYNVKLQTD